MKFRSNLFILSRGWAATGLCKTLSSFPVAVLQKIFCICLFVAVLYRIMGSSRNSASAHLVVWSGNGKNHFAGSSDCGLVLNDIYSVPWPKEPAVSPFCSSRAALLEAMSFGSRHEWNKPYVGKECMYRWFPAPEICMILERFNAISFVGDHTGRSIYAAFNILLREDFALGGLRSWVLSEEDRTRCRCDKQFLDRKCHEYMVKASKEYVDLGSGNLRGGHYVCQSVPHAYIQVDSTPAPTTVEAQFKELTYGKPHPWQPSPLIFSFGQGFALSLEDMIPALTAWADLAAGAKRNIPMLFISPPAFNPKKPLSTLLKSGNADFWSFAEELRDVAKQKKFEVLSLYNLTLQAEIPDGESFGMNVGLVEAMMVINWLSKLETS